MYIYALVLQILLNDGKEYKFECIADRERCIEIRDRYIRQEGNRIQKIQLSEEKREWKLK